MNLQTEIVEGILVIHINEKRIDRHVSEDFKKDLHGFINSGHYKLVVDLTNVEFMDSGGIGVIIAALPLVKGKGEIVAYGMNEVVSKILTVSGLRNYLVTTLSLRSAIEAVQKVK
jgi:anti-sigma B factor antagonist